MIASGIWTHAGQWGKFSISQWDKAGMHIERLWTTSKLQFVLHDETDLPVSFPIVLTVTWTLIPSPIIYFDSVPSF